MQPASIAPKDRLKHAADSDALKALARQLIDISQRMM